MPKLTVRLPGLPPVTHALGGAVITVGRTPDNDIQIADPSVSKHHAKLELNNGEYTVHDLGATNGTFVNNQRIRNALVRHSDLIRFANIDTVFETDALDDDVVPGAVTLPPGTPSAPVNVTSTALTAAARSAAAPAVARPAAAAPGTAKPTGFSPKTSALPKGTAKKSLPTWLLIVGGVIFVALVGYGVHWWMNQSSGVEPAPAPATSQPAPKSETNASAPDAGKIMAEEKALAAEAAALANKPITSADAPAVGALLRDEDPKARRNAARILHTLGNDARPALAAIRDAVKDSDPDTRFWSALALAQLDPADQASVPVLLEAVKNENPAMRAVAARSLAVIHFQGDDATPIVEILRKAAEADENEDVRKAAGSAAKLLSAAVKAPGL